LEKFLGIFTGVWHKKFSCPGATHLGVLQRGNNFNRIGLLLEFQMQISGKPPPKKGQLHTNFSPKNFPIFNGFFQ
jgi:hypothetical protein